MTGQAGPPAAPVLAIALGDTRALAAGALAERFPGRPIVWLDRGAAHQPLRLLWHLASRRHGDAVLFAADLRAPRLRVTSLVLAATRAERRWRCDVDGRVQPFSPVGHLRANGLALARHAVACGLAACLGLPLLRLAGLLVADRAEGQTVGRPGRVLYLRSQFWLRLRGGGSVAHAAGVIGGLQAAGVAVWVVSSDSLHGVSAPTTVLPPECWWDGGARDIEELAYTIPLLVAALRVARRFRPELVYQRYAAFNCTGVLLSRLLRVPLVLEFNSSEVWKGRHWGSTRHLGLAAAAERLNLRAADRVVVVSRVLRETLVADGVAPDKILVNPNGVDPTRFRPDVSRPDVRARHGLARHPVVGFAGTFGVWHGIPTLAAALPLIAGARPAVRFLLMGDGPLRRLVDEAIAATGLAERVVMTGLVPHEAMPAYLAACDVLLSPHGRQVDGGEFFGSPTKLYEYMAAGRAIVASEVGQIGEVLGHGDTALLVPPDDAAALAAAVVRLVDDAALRARLGAAARARAEAEHTWRQNAERVLAALASSGDPSRHPSPKGRGRSRGAPSRDDARWLAPRPLGQAGRVPGERSPRSFDPCQGLA